MLCIFGIALIASLLACNDTVDEVATKINSKTIEKSDVFSSATGGKVEKDSTSTISQVPDLKITDTSVQFSENDPNIVGIPVHISGAPDVAGVQFELLYDPESLQFEDIIPGALIKDFLFESATDQINGVISVAAIGMRDSKGTGEVAIAKFKPLKENKLQLTIRNLIMADSDLKPIKVTHKPGNITINNVDKRMPKIDPGKSNRDKTDQRTPSETNTIKPRR